MKQTNHITLTSFYALKPSISQYLPNGFSQFVLTPSRQVLEQFLHK
jgi:hypothetical protein